MAMQLEDYQEELRGYIKRVLEANNAAKADTKSEDFSDYFDGANAALEELAVHFELVEGYGKL